MKDGLVHLGLSKGLIERFSLRLNERYLNAGYEGSIIEHFADLVYRAWLVFFGTLTAGALVILLTRTGLGIVIGAMIVPVGLLAFTYPFIEIKSLEQTKAAGLKNEYLFIGFVLLVFVDGQKSVVDAFRYLKTSKLFNWIKRDSALLETSVTFDGKTPVEALMERATAATDEETKTLFSGIAHATSEAKIPEFLNREIDKFNDVLLANVKAFNKSILFVIKYTFLLAFIPLILLMLGMFASSLTYFGALVGIVAAPVYLVTIRYIIAKARPQALRLPKQSSLGVIDGFGAIIGILTFLATDQVITSVIVGVLGVTIIYTVRTRGKKGRNRLAEAALPALIDEVSNAKTANKTILQGLTDYSNANGSSPLGAHVKRVFERYYTTGVVESRTGIWLVDYVINVLGLMSVHDSSALLMQKFKNMITDTYKSRTVKGYTYANGAMYLMPFVIGIITAIGLGIPGLLGNLGSVLNFSVHVTPLLTEIAYANVIIVSLSVAIAMQYIKNSLDNPIPIIIVLGLTTVVVVVLMPLVTGMMSGLLPTFNPIPGGYYPTG